MITYKVKNEPTPIIVRNAAELVRYLNSTAKMPSPSDSEYMLDYSKRSVIHRDADIRATDAESFIADLIAVGDIEIVQ